MLVTFAEPFRIFLPKFLAVNEAQKLLIKFNHFWVALNISESEPVNYVVIFPFEDGSVLRRENPVD